MDNFKNLKNLIVEWVGFYRFFLKPNNFSGLHLRSKVLSVVLSSNTQMCWSKSVGVAPNSSLLNERDSSYSKRSKSLAPEPKHQLESRTCVCFIQFPATFSWRRRFAKQHKQIETTYCSMRFHHEWKFPTKKKLWKTKDLLYLELESHRVLSLMFGYVGWFSTTSQCIPQVSQHFGNRIIQLKHFWKLMAIHL